MKRKLRHPIRSITEPYGKAGLTVAILALVLAMVGGAYAAGGLSSKQKKEVTAIAKKFAGKPGAPGTNGTNGTNGAPGKEGAPGKNGENGKAGENGKSVVTSSLAPGAGGCPEGGASVEVEGSSSPESVCNGEKGEKGEKGEPWSPNNTLPTGATETGSFGASGTPVAMSGYGGKFVIAPIGFPIKLANALPANAIYLIGGGFPENEGEKLQAEHWHSGSEELCQGSTGSELTTCEAKFKARAKACPGSSKTPGAAKGNLCVFISSESQNIDLGVEREPFPKLTLKGPPVTGFGKSWFLRSGEYEEGVSEAGTELLLKHEGTGAEETEPLWIVGTWAVTGE